MAVGNSRNLIDADNRELAAKSKLMRQVPFDQEQPEIYIENYHEYNCTV